MNDDSVICAACNTGNPAGARFCNQCGARLGDAAPGYTPRHLGALAQTPQGERKWVTVLFADVKGSTRLAEQAGPELWHEVLDRFFAILTRVVHRYDGTINQYTGDGIMALFGAPRALEEHAQFAARAALEMQHDVRRYADELRLSHGLNLSMRVGLNSGEVVVGRIGDDLRSDYTAQGPTVNLAARMEQICEPGRIYATRATATQLEGYFRMRSLGATEVAGAAAPVEVFEIEGIGGLRTRLDRSLARVGSPFIGRERELARLVAAVDQVRSGGGGQVIAVVGNAGIGKSRLCHELLQACRRDGVTVLQATGVPYASRVPMFPIRQLLRAKLGVPSGAAAQEARRWIAGALLLEDPANAAVLPHVFDFLGIAEGAERPPADGDPAVQQRMLAQLADYLPCSETPLILLIEDLHFLDRATEAFLPSLCRAARARGCLLLLNYRPDYASEWLEPLLDEAIALSALDAGQLRQLAQTLLGEDPSVQGLAQMVAARAGGNPYFVEEAVLSLVDGGWLQGRPRDWRLVRPVDDWPLPDSVQALLGARIDRLPEGLRSRLQTAAVIGLEFEPALLASLAGADVDDDVAALEELGFLHHRGDDVAFCHSLVQEVAYRGQLESHRRSVHARLAELLEARHGGIDAAPQEISLRIAHHWQQAAQWARAGSWNLVAARWAMAQSMAVTYDQYRRALANYDRAADSPEVHRGRIAARAAMIRMAQFATISEEEVDRLYAEGRAMAEACGDVACEAELRMSYGNDLMRRAQVDAAAAAHEEAVQLCFAHGRRELVNRFRLAILITHNAAGRLRRALEILDAAGGDWRTRPIDDDNYASRGFYGLMLSWLGRLDEAAQHVDEAIAHVERSGHLVGWIYGNRVDLAFLSGDFAPALPAATRALELAEKMDSPFFRAIALRAYGLALSLNGRSEEAIDALREAQPMVARGAPAHQFEAHLFSTQALALLGAQREAEAEAAARAARASAHGAGSRIWEIAAWLAWLRLPATAERRAEAQSGIARVDELIAFTGAEGFRPWLHLARAHWSSDAEQRECSRALAQAAFTAIGARAYAQRLAERRAQEVPTMRQSA